MDHPLLRNQKVQPGILQPKDVLVFVLDKQDPDGVDFESPVWDELAEAADVWLCPVWEENNAKDLAETMR